MRRRSGPWAFVVAVAAAVSLAPACHEDQPCDSGTTFEAGMCKLRPRDAGAATAADGAVRPEGGAGPTFGTPCMDGVNHTDCQGAVVNACFVLPGQTTGFCSYVGCDKDNRCPADWMCVDLSKFQPGAPWGCVKL